MIPEASGERENRSFPTGQRSAKSYKETGLFQSRRRGQSRFRSGEEGEKKGTVAFSVRRETGQGLSISGAHRVAAVERLVGATLVVALPPNGATVRRPLLGHYRTGGWRDGSTGERCDPAGHPQGVPLRSSGIGSFKEVPLRRAAGMIRPETGRGWSISGAHRVADVQQLGPYWAGGWRDGSAGERCDPVGHPQGAPLRSSGIEVTKKGGLSCPPVFRPLYDPHWSSAVGNRGFTLFLPGVRRTRPVGELFSVPQRILSSALRAYRWSTWWCSVQPSAVYSN